MVIGLYIFPVSNPSNDPGQELAEQYCSTCHQFPNPEILTKRSWNYLLTDMGFRLGIIDYSPVVDIPPVAMQHLTTRERILHQANAIPGKPLLSEKEWSAIREYYSENAPQKPLSQNKKPRVSTRLEQFNLRIPNYQPRASVFTLTRINDEHGGLLLGNIKDQSLTILDKNLERTGSYGGQDIVVDVLVKEDSIILLEIGDLMGGFIGIGKGSLQIKAISNGSLTRLNTVVDRLHRPVSFEFADLNQNGSNELIVCNFGDVTGNVSLFQADGSLITELINAPGAIRSQVHDFDNDGKPDIAVLMGDARENISLLMNQGNHTYERKEVVSCHSSYGHTYFELQDFNKDGHMDLLATNGDTDADPFNTLKNYHGIRIYMNDGNNNFELAFFYPMYGAHFAKAADFDKDGDLDIAASAFFPDFSSDKPEQFTYLENKGDLEFQPRTHIETFQGRWMTMDIGDYDMDGDVDIALGGGYLPLGMMVDHREKYKSLVTSGKAILVFENRLIE